MDLVPVKKSTLATWCREVKLTEAEYAAIKNRTASREGVPRDTQRERRREIEKIRSRARAQVPTLIHDPLWVAGTVLYWAEGAKTRNQLKMANADPRALRLFVAWILRYVNPDGSFSLHLHLHEGNDDEAARAYWRAETGLATANFYKTFIKPRGTGHRKNHLPHGVCTVKVRRCADAWQQTMAWVEFLADHLGLPDMRY
jgi:hypothetical protein